jgi:putative ABC transport system substrate-binding protein
MGGKWLEILKEAAPRAARIPIVYNLATAPYALMFLPAMQAAAARMTVALMPAPVHSYEDIERAVVALGDAGDGGLIVLPDSSASASASSRLPRSVEFPRSTRSASSPRTAA